MQSRRNRPLALLAALAAAVSLLVAPGAGHAEPVNPSDGEISAAKVEKARVAGLVGQLSAEMASMQAELHRLHIDAELAKQRYADALHKLAQAKAAATAARAAMVKAQADAAASHGQFALLIRSQYIHGAGTTPTGSLWTATDPDALLQRGTYQRYSATRQMDVVAVFRKAQVAKSNAEAAARDSVNRQNSATDAAKQARAAAAQAVAQGEQRKRAIDARMSATRTRLEAAQLNLATLEQRRSEYIAWKQAEEERIARERAEAEARRRAEEEAARRASEEAARKAREREQQPPVSRPAPTPAPSGGGWTAAKGQTAVNRAMQYLGIAYTFAGGNYDGPTYGVAVDHDSRNDASVYGFDCSGLVMYAWAPYARYDHFAATQYVQAGSFHPSVGQLLPGDLVFWGHTQATIHHVGIYVGGGNVIHAPFSGSYVQVQPLGVISDDYYGATRPLT